MTACPVCGTQNSDNHSYCYNCGANLRDSGGSVIPGTVLDKRYIIIKKLGQGGMGAVYLAYDRKLGNRPVALKELNSKSLAPEVMPATVQAFKKEASILTLLRHQALPVITDFFPRGEFCWYLVMDYIKGETLKETVQRHGPIHPAMVLDWAKQICSILDYLHTETPAIIFRDLKPDNIMLGGDGYIKLIDFGIARHFKPEAKADTTKYGSSGFAPPEQYGYNQTDARSDIYSLGATLHYLLTGIDPLNSPFLFASLKNNEAVGPEFALTIMKALELNPSNRPGSAQEMLALLNDIKDLPVNSDEKSALLEDIMGKWADDVMPETNSFYTEGLSPDDIYVHNGICRGKDSRFKIAAGLICLVLLLSAAWFGYGRSIADGGKTGANVQALKTTAGGIEPITAGAGGKQAGTINGDVENDPLNNWKKIDSPFGSKAFRNVSYGNGVFVAVGLDGVMLYSADGIDWKSSDFIANVGTNGALWGIAYGNGIFVAVGSNGVIITSTDGKSWTKREPGTSSGFRAVTYGNGLFVAVAKDIATSPDGINWTVSAARQVDDLNGVAYGNAMYLAVGLKGAVLTSDDAVDWTARDTGISADLSGAAYGNNMMLALGDNGGLFSSADGINWTSRESKTGCHLRFAIYTGNMFVAVGDVGTILTSPDGVNWTNRTSGTYGARCGAACGGGSLVVVGYDDPILQSTL